MNANPRGFADTLEPVRQRAQWRFDAALRALARLHADKHEAQSDRARLVEQLATQAGHAQAAWRERADPLAAAGALQYIALLQALEAKAARRIADLEHEVAQARQECLLRQSRLEALQQHRLHALADFAREGQRKESVRADQDWLARGQQLTGGALQ